MGTKVNNFQKLLQIGPRLQEKSQQIQRKTWSSKLQKERL